MTVFVNHFGICTNSQNELPGRARLDKLSPKLSNRPADVVHANLEHLEVLHRLMLGLAAQRDPKRVLHRVIESALAICGGDFGAIYLTLPSGQLELRYAVGATVDEAGFRESVAGAVVSSGSGLLVSDYAQHSSGQQGSVICAPLHSNERVIGAITLITKDRTEAYSTSDLRTLERFALLSSAVLDTAQVNQQLQLDAALEQARLHDLSESARRLAQKKNLLLSATHEINLELNQQRDLNTLLLLLLERSLELLDVDAGGIYMIEADQIKLVAALGDELLPVAPLGFGVSGHVAQSGKSMFIGDYLHSPFHIDDHPGASWRSVMSVPLCGAHNRVIGVLTVVDTRQAQRFDDDSLETLERFAALASLAVENTALLEATVAAAGNAQRKGDLLDALSQISLELVAHDDAQGLLQKLTERTSELFQADAAVVYLLSEGRTEYQRVAWHGSSPSETGTYGRGLSGRAMALGEPLSVADYSLWEGRDLGVDEVGVWRGAMSAPLKRGTVIIGALTIASVQQADCFTNTDLETLQRFAALASVALENARLYALERQNLSDERVRMAITQKISKLRSVKDSALALVQVLAESLNYEYIAIYRFDEAGLTLQAKSGDFEPPTQLSPQQGVTGRVIRNARAELVIDSASDPDWISFSPQLTSIVCVPLMGRDGVIGTLSVEGSADKPLTPADLEMLGALVPAFSTTLENATLHERLESLRLEAVHAARHDPLTGLRNRRAFEEDLAVILEQWRVARQGFSLAVIDLAGFKAINDSLGHAAGDHALCRIADVLSGESTGTHRAYRIGGDEFLLLIPDSFQPLPLLRDLGSRIQHLEFATGLAVTPNIGVASCPSDSSDPDRLQSLADKRMYAAKAAGQSMLGSDAPSAPRRRAGER